MKKSVTLTTSITTDLTGRDRPEGLPLLYNSLFRVLQGSVYTVLGFCLLTVIWYLVSLLTKGGLPTPLATFQVFWELIKDPFYDYGPNDKGIGL